MPYGLIRSTTPIRATPKQSPRVVTRMHTASSRATLDIMLEVLDKGYARVTNLNGDYSDDCARSVLQAMEERHYLHRVRDRAHTYYIGYELSMALSAREVDHAFVDLGNVGDMTYEEYQDAFLSALEDEIPGDEQ